jgi:hypothetical protein
MDEDEASPELTAFCRLLVSVDFWLALPPALFCDL